MKDGRRKGADAKKKAESLLKSESAFRQYADKLPNDFWILSVARVRGWGAGRTH